MVRLFKLTLRLCEQSLVDLMDAEVVDSRSLDPKLYSGILRGLRAVVLDRVLIASVVVADGVVIIILQELFERHEEDSVVLFLGPEQGPELGRPLTVGVRPLTGPLSLPPGVPNFD